MSFFSNNMSSFVAHTLNHTPYLLCTLPLDFQIKYLAFDYNFINPTTFYLLQNKTKNIFYDKTAPKGDKKKSDNAALNRHKILSYALTNS